MSRRFVTFDWAIKKLLRSKANFGILEGFLSELLTPGQDLKIVRLLESESNRNDQDNKFNRVDILAELATGELVLIEVQVDSEADFLQRMLFGTSKVIAEHMKVRDDYAKIKKVYSVNILYFDLGYGEDYIYHGTTQFVGIHKRDQLQLNDRQKSLYQKELISEIYPEYYLIKVNNFDDLAKNSLDEWIYFLKNEDIQGKFPAKGLGEAKEKLDVMKLPEQERKAYESYLDNLHYQASMMVGSFDEGKVEGIAEGKVEGRVEGIAEGRAQERREVAKKMKELGMDTKVIQEATGLELAELERL